MHKYVPRVTVSIKHMGTFQAVESMNFNETMFYAVTAYQNQKVINIFLPLYSIKVMIVVIYLFIYENLLGDSVKNQIQSFRQGIPWE